MCRYMGVPPTIVIVIGFDDNGDDDDAVGNDNEYVDGRSHPVIHQGLV